MNFDKAIELLNAALVEQNPKTFSGTWVYKHVPRAYRFFRLNLRTPTDSIDWDAVTLVLDRSFQYKWKERRCRTKASYESKSELDLVLTTYREKIYTLIAPMDENDRRTQHRILVALVRLSQRGNVLAQQEAIKFVRYTVDDWMEKYYVLQRWNGFGEILEEQITACIRRYRFTGSFLGYVFKTLEYAGRGLAPLYSLDTPLSPLGGRTWAENVVQDTDTGEIQMRERK